MGIIRQVPGEEACAGHALHLCFLPFRLQSSRGRKASGRSRKASSCTTPLMSLRAKAWTQTQRAPSAPGSGRASCPRMTTGPPTSTISRGSGTGSPSQLWQVRSQRPHSEAAAHLSGPHLCKGSLSAQVSHRVSSAAGPFIDEDPGGNGGQA